MNEQIQTINLQHINDNETPIFTVCRDGEVDAQYYAEQRRSARVEALQSAFSALGHNVVSGLRNAARDTLTPLILDIEDAANHSDLRKQYFARKRAERLGSIASRYDLNL